MNWEFSELYTRIMNYIWHNIKYNLSAYSKGKQQGVYTWWKFLTVMPLMPVKNKFYNYPKIQWHYLWKAITCIESHYIKEILDSLP